MARRIRDIWLFIPCQLYKHLRLHLGKANQYTGLAVNIISIAKPLTFCVRCIKNTSKSLQGRSSLTSCLISENYLLVDWLNPGVDLPGGCCLSNSMPGRRSRGRDGKPAAQTNCGKAGGRSFLSINSIGLRGLIFPFHEGSTAKQESWNTFTDVFLRGGIVVGGISKAHGSCSILRPVHPCDILESRIQHQVSGGLLPQIHSLELNLSSC